MQLCRSLIVLKPHSVQNGEHGVWLHLLYTHVLLVIPVCGDVHLLMHWLEVLYEVNGVQELGRV